MKVTRSGYSCMFNLDISTKKMFFGDQKNVFRGSYHHFDSLEWMLFQKIRISAMYFQCLVVYLKRTQRWLNETHFRSSYANTKPPPSVLYPLSFWARALLSSRGEYKWWFHIDVYLKRSIQVKYEGDAVVTKASDHCFRKQCWSMRGRASAGWFRFNRAGSIQPYRVPVPSQIVYRILLHCRRACSAWLVFVSALDKAYIFEFDVVLFSRIFLPLWIGQKAWKADF